MEHGAESTCNARQEWTWQGDVKLAILRPGKAAENRHIGSFIGRLSDEYLSVNRFMSMDDALRMGEASRRDDYRHR
jgi:hypothetical protein